MQKRSDEALVAYLDGELDDAERHHLEAWLEADPAARERMAALAASANLVRGAFDEIINEKVPERLIAAARGTAPATADSGAEIVVFKQPGKANAAPVPRSRWWVAAPVAASLLGLIGGGGAGYFGIGSLLPSIAAGSQQALETAAVNNSWLNNAAGYYKLYVSGRDSAMIDASGDATVAMQKISQSLPQQVRLPNLKPWSLNFHGARLVVVDGKPAAQLVYTTDNKAIGPLTLSIGWSNQPDIPPTFDRRQDVNLLYWRHQGRAYVLVGQTDIGYLWGIANDVAWQLDAI